MGSRRRVATCCLLLACFSCCKVNYKLNIDSTACACYGYVFSDSATDSAKQGCRQLPALIKSCAHTHRDEVACGIGLASLGFVLPRSMKLIGHV